MHRLVLALCLAGAAMVPCSGFHTAVLPTRGWGAAIAPRLRAAAAARRHATAPPLRMQLSNEQLAAAAERGAAREAVLAEKRRARADREREAREDERCVFAHHASAIAYPAQNAGRLL